MGAGFCQNLAQIRPPLPAQLAPGSLFWTPAYPHVGKGEEMSEIILYDAIVMDTFVKTIDCTIQRGKCNINSG